MLLPMDQYHPATAGPYGLDHYIDKMSIIDLHNGQSVASIINNTILTTGGEIAVSLVFTPGAPPILPDGKPADPTRPNPIEPQTIPLMLYSKQDNCLVPTGEYNALFETTLHGCIHPDAVVEPGKYCTAFEGTQLDKAYVQGDALIYPNLQHYHFYDSLAAAFSKLIAEPTVNFDMAHAVSSGAPFYFEKGLLTTIATTPAIIAEITLVPPPGLSQGTPLPLTGRFLDVFPPIPEPLVSPTFQTRMRRNIDFSHVQLDEWVLDENYILQSTRNLQSFIATLGILSPQAAHRTDYVCKKLHLFRQKEDDPASKTREAIFHLHTDEFSAAFAELIDHPVNQHDPGLVISYNLDSQVLSGAITDRDGHIIAEYTNEQPAKCETPGLYLAIRQDYLQHPALMPLCSNQLMQDSPNWNVERGEMVYFQIGQYDAGELRSTLGYLKFQLLQKAIFIDELLQRHPDKAATIPPPDVTEPYSLRLRWELRTPGQPVQQFFSQRTCPATAVALVEFFSLPNDLYTGKAPALAPYDLRLVIAEVLEGPDRHVVLKSHLSKDDPGKVAYFYNPEDASAHLRQFIESGTGQDTPYPLTSAAAHRPRNIAPDPPSSQQQQKGPSP
ncbi:hypothetical protein HB364_13870 [Pseudoflavitalea sp. X16]|uniref:hypothetical protein n=1 Tax=Paraflavitalea devenefica TaxID=2716334 RepID=UPI0014231AAC|nr:hypothetical protein [Paraflavitalea devenefica]NII26176.1 hypothetical protein [Paraflavitalea devenefica]